MKKLGFIIFWSISMCVSQSIMAADVGSLEVHGTLVVDLATTLTTTLAHGGSPSVSASEGVALNGGATSGEFGLSSVGTASGFASSALGFAASATNSGSHADSWGNSSGTYSHADSNGTASGNFSHAGARGTASGTHAFALGFAALASGDFSGAFGEYVSATHDNSFIFGTGFSTDTLTTSEKYEVVFGSRGVEAILIHFDEILLKIATTITGDTTLANVSVTGVVTDTLHVQTASAGSVTASAVADDLVVENSGDGGITILAPDASNAQLYFGGPNSPIGAFLRWVADDDALTLSTTSGAHDLILQATGGNVGVGNTTLPSYGLDVDGTFRTTGDGLFDSDLSVSGDIALTGNLTATGFIDSPSNYDVSNEGLILAYNFNSENLVGSTGSESILDSSTRNNHGTNSSAIHQATGGFNDGGCFAFDGSNKYVSFTTGVTWAAGEPYSCSAWCKVTGSISTGSNQLISNRVGTGAGQFLQLIKSNATWKFNYDSGGGGSFATGGTVTADWSFLVGVYDGTDIILYVDGEQAGIAGSPPYASAALTADSYKIGRRSDQDSENFEGLIDDVRVYERALSADEIKALYLQRAETHDSYVSQSDITVDASGNVGIDELAPDSKLEVNGTFHATGAATLDLTLIFSAQGTSVNEFSVDGTLAGNSDDAIPTEKAVKTYVDAQSGGSFTIAGDTGTSPIEFGDTLYVIGTDGQIVTAEADGEVVISLTDTVEIVTSLGVGNDPTERFVVGSDLGNINTGEVFVVGNTAGDSHFMIAQDATHGLTGTWQYNATAANAKAYVNTFGYSNDLFIDGDDLFLQDASTGNARVGIGNNETFDGGAILQVGTGGADCDGTNWNDGCFERLKIGIVSVSTTASWNLLDSLQPRKYQYRIREKVYHLWDGQEVLSLDGITSVTTEIRRVMKPIEKYNRQVMEMGNDLSIVPRFEDILTTRPATMREMITSTTIRITDRGNGRDTYGLVWEELPEILRNPGGVNGTKIAAFNMSVLKEAKTRIESLENQVKRLKSDRDADRARFENLEQMVNDLHSVAHAEEITISLDYNESYTYADVRPFYESGEKMVIFHDGNVGI